MGSKTTSQNTTQYSAPINQAALQSIYGQVAGAASTPYQAYNGELTAPVNAQQTAGINNINAASNYASPYIQSAAGLAQGAANPLTSSEIQQYQNPYTQNVVNATQAQFNDLNGQQQNQVKGNAAMAGALGGDRQAVAQSTLAGQQALNEAPTIANLYSNSYNSGLQTAAQQYQQNPLAAASAIGNLGVAGQTAALQGAGAQVGAGTLQQQSQQAADTAAYQQYQAAQGFPYQQAAFLEQYGVPSALAQGSSSSGTQTGQGPNNLAPYLGAGVAAASLLLKDGGKVEGYAPGGGVGYINAPDYITSGAGYIPMGQASPNTLQAPNLSFMKQPAATPLSNTDMKGLAGVGTSLKNDFGSASFGGGNALSGDAWGGDKANPLEGLSASDYGYATGGLVKAIHEIHRSIKGARKGSAPTGHFDDGGDVSFADRFQPATDNPFGDLSKGQALKLLEHAPAAEDSPVINPDQPLRMPDQGAVQAWRDGADQPNPAVAADAAPLSNPTSLPPQITNPDNAPPDAANPMVSAYTQGQGTGPMGANGQPTDILPVEKPQQDQGGHGLLGLSDKTKQSLLAAGLGLMASRSPFLGQALGEGGLQGLKAYSDQTAAEQASAEKAATRAQEQQRIDIQAKQLAANLDEHKRTAASAALIVGPDGKTMITNPEYIAEKTAEAGIKDKTPAGYRETKDGNYEAIPGGPADPAVLRAGAEAKRIANAVLDDDTIHDMAGQYLAGDRTVMQNLGRGAQGAENIVKLRQAIAKQARDAGVDPKGIVNQFNEQAGALAGQRAVGTRAANISLAANEANNMIPIALEASDKLPRSQYMPWNQMVQAVQKGSSSPELASFVAATNSLVNSYVRAVSPSGVPTDSMRQHAYDMLNAAQGPEAYKAVVATMRLEMQAALQAPGQVKAELRKGNEPVAAAGAPAAPAPARIEKAIGDKKYYSPDGGKTWYAQ